MIFAFLLLFLPKGENLSYGQAPCSDRQGLAAESLQNMRCFCIFHLLGICGSSGSGSGAALLICLTQENPFYIPPSFTVGLFLPFQVVTLSLP